MKTLVFLFIAFLAPSAEAYVENVIHGYMNCMACHHSPSGGGILNDYGRSLSRELMSTWKGPEGFEKPVWGLVPNQENVNFGGHFRGIQTKSKNDQFERGRLFAMQQNIELAVRTKNVWIVATAGTQEGPKGVPGKDEFISERHYVTWENAADERVRTGKFRQNYGLGESNHTRYIKSALGFGSLSENYQLEFNKYFDTGELTLSSALGANLFSSDPSEKRSDEKNIATTAAYYYGEKSKIGVSALLGETPARKRSLMGIYGILGFGAHSFVKYEFDYEYSKTIALESESKGLFAGFISLGHQLFKGVTVSVLHEQLQRDLSDGQTRVHAPGVGVQWLPLPHFELQVEYKREFSKASPGNPLDSSWVLFHFYL